MDARVHDTPLSDRELFSISETAGKAGVGVTSVYGEIRTGRLRSVKIGRRRMIPAAALAEWLDSLPSPPLEPVEWLSRDRAGGRR
jgi:excisionase family DNA binding protein